MSWLKFVVLLCVVFVCECQDKSKCENKQTCSACIQELGCVWCSQPTGASLQLSGECRHESQVDAKWCPSNKLNNPQSLEQIVENVNLESGKNGPAVQMKPQRIHLQLRKGMEHELKFQYAQASNYPVDLYYIMDHSASMKEHKNKLAELGGELVSVMKAITNDFRLGFGSFVDKTDMPFINIAPNKINAPCTGCAKAYSYINHLSLTGEYNQFSEQVKAANVSGNLDAPEGGFDALVQAIVCKSVIGWRPKARHIIVFSTDAEFHVAGDGKLAGVVEPNDARCHVENNIYTKTLVYDYPSVSFLNHIAKENNVNLIFAIVRHNARSYRMYEALQTQIENSGVGELKDGSNNVVDLVIENYNKIVDAVRITDNSTSTVEIKYHANCPNVSENGCTNLHAGDIVAFTATIKALECQNDSNTHTIQIKPEGVNEALIVNLEVMCGCDCEHDGHPDYVHSSQECSNSGDLKCGVCFCNAGNFGLKCECDTSSAQIDDDKPCTKPNDTQICSSQGTCKCGQCVCTKRSDNQLIYGKYCECDNYSCKRHNGLICAGENNGRCDCGVCACFADWTGVACECPNSRKSCVFPNGDGSICSGHGSCVCGECQCNNDENKYTGQYCEECASCPGQRCQELHPCVECQAYKTGIYDEVQCQQNCTLFATELVDLIDEEDTKDENVKTCRTIDSVGCTIVFQYAYDDFKRLHVKALKQKNCPEPVDILKVVLFVIGSIVLAGLVLLAVWKIFTSIHDKREYAKFENERKNAKWNTGQNPLYKGATSTFSNPTYRG